MRKRRLRDGNSQRSCEYQVAEWEFMWVLVVSDFRACLITYTLTYKPSRAPLAHLQFANAFW